MEKERWRQSERGTEGMREGERAWERERGKERDSRLKPSKTKVLSRQ